MKKELSNRSKVFIMEYVKDKNATTAAIMAGYSEKTAGATGCRLLKDERIAKAIDEMLKNVNKGKTITISFIIAKLMGIAERSEQRGEPRDAIKCYELLGKHLGMFTEKIENKSEVTFKSASDIRSQVLNMITEAKEEKKKCQ